MKYNVNIEAYVCTNIEVEASSEEEAEEIASNDMGVIAFLKEEIDSVVNYVADRIEP